MSEFNKFLLNSEYMQKYCFIQKIKGCIFVEGLSDVNFWRDIVNNNNYKINFASDQKTRGKSVLLKHIEKTGKYAIFAIDSDYDSLCRNSSERGRKISENNYVLQTILYSKESLINHHENLESYLKRVSIGDDFINFPVRQYMEDYSSVIYDVLLTFISLKKLNINEFNSKRLHKAISPDTPIISQNFELQRDPLTKVKMNVVKLVREMQEYLFSQNVSADQLNSLKHEIELEGINKKNCCYYINGHFLEKNVINPLINSLKSRFNLRHTSKLRSEAKGDLETFKKNKSELDKYITENFSFNTFITMNEITKPSKIITEIRQKHTRMSFI